MTKPFDQYKLNIDDFTITKNLNKGMFGFVKVAKRLKDDKEFAIKNIIGSNDPKIKIYVSNEIKILMQVQHPTIIRFYGFSYRDWDHKNNITLFFEFMENGSLEKYIRGENKGELENTERQIILIGISRGMMILHEKNIIHRDLKPGNVLLDKDCKPHITDFGQSRHFNPNDDSNNQIPDGMGTLNYMAPEVIAGNEFNMKADVYSFGILMYELVTGKEAFKDWHFNALQQGQKIMEGQRPQFEDDSIKKGLRNMIEKCWDQNPNERPSFSEIFKKLCFSTDPYLLGFEDNLEKEKIVDREEEEEEKEFDDDDENIVKVDDNKINIKYCLNDVDYNKVLDYVNEITVEPKSIDNAKNEELKDEIKKLKQKTNEQEEAISKMKTKPFDHYKLNINDFKIIKKLNKGTFGIVKMAKRLKDDKEFAIKSIIGSNDPQYKIHILREIKILIQVQHPTIVRFYGFSYKYWNRKNNVKIFLEFMENGSLEKYISGKKKGELESTERQIILIGIARGMMILHEKNIIHRDLKPGNVLIDKDCKPHITDFGQSKYFNPNDSKNQTSDGMGTPNYMAPEVITGNKFNIKADVYSFGIIMYEIVTGKEAFKDWDIPIFQQKKKITNGDRPQFEDDSIKKGLRNMIEKCWDQDPKKRPSFSEIFKKLCLSTDPYLLGFEDNLEKEKKKKKVDDRNEEEEEEKEKDFDDEDYDYDDEDDDENIKKVNDNKINIKYCLDGVDYNKVLDYVNEIIVSPKSIDEIENEKLKDEIENLKEIINNQMRAIPNMEKKDAPNVKNEEVEELKEEIQKLRQKTNEQEKTISSMKTELEKKSDETSFNDILDKALEQFQIEIKKIREEKDQEIEHLKKQVEDLNKKLKKDTIKTVEDVKSYIKIEEEEEDDEKITKSSDDDEEKRKETSSNSDDDEEKRKETSSNSDDDEEKRKETSSNSDDDDEKRKETKLEEEEEENEIGNWKILESIEYESPESTGIINYLGNKVTITCDCVYPNINNIRSKSNSNFFYNWIDGNLPTSEEDGYIDFDFGSDKVEIHSYVIRPCNKGQYKRTPISWKIIGYDDKEDEWVEIDSRNLEFDERDIQNILNNKYQIKKEYKSKRFSSIRYIQNESSLPGQRYYISISYFEFFGNIYRNI